MWTDRRILDLFAIELPIIQAPMAGPTTPDLVVAVSEAGGLGSLAAAMLSPDEMRRQLQSIRQRTARPINVNFFCHTPPVPDAAREAAWRARLAGYYAELGLPSDAKVAGAERAPFNAEHCAVLEDIRPEVVSFHFGLPEPALRRRLRAVGARLIASATTVAEARWLEKEGVDAVIAQGNEAGGHRGMFLTDDIAAQAGTFALVPQTVDAVRVPVIAAGGIADGRGVAAALVLGAAAAQVGTAYMLTPEAKVSEVHRAALKAARDDGTSVTNVFTGRPARGLINRVMREVGPMATGAPAFPLAASAIAPLKAAAEAKGLGDFTSLWSGQAAALAREEPAGPLTRRLAEEARACLRKMAGA